ncbi:MAG: competence/damage-inducible protein A [bacterium]
MKAELISIGDELLIGQTVNTNATYLAKGLTELGVEVKWVVTIGDDADELRSALATAMQRSELVIATGGLGPTHDDITKRVAAEFFEADLTLNTNLLDHLRHTFALRGLRITTATEEQALVPDKAAIIPNPVGTAPGLIFKKDERRCIILPGVPAEMTAMCEQTVFPMFAGQSQVILFKTLRTTGIPESTLFEKIGDIAQIERLARVAFLPKTSGVDIRLTVAGTDAAACRRRIEQGVQRIQARVGKYIYAYDDQSLEEVVAQHLFESGKTLAVAESCTGGLLANKLTNVSGSSSYFERGVVAYSNQAKMDLLGVPEALLKSQGAVSSETAVAMAEGVRNLAGTDFGLSTTGIAGPTGGSAEKPVGLVFIGFAGPGTSYSKRFVFLKDRRTNKERSVQAALELLRTEFVAPQ